MKVIFYNIVKNTLPLLVTTNCMYHEYVSSLSTSSMRFLNLSYRTFNSKIRVVLDYNITKSDLRFVTTEGKVGLANLLINNIKSDVKNHCFVKYYIEDELISYNHISLTRSTITSGYCNCFFIFNEAFKSKIFNTFSWFKFIELIITSKIADVIDLVVDTELYDYVKITNNIQYNIDDLQNSYSYLLSRDKATGGFNDNNSSKFLFLTKQDKKRQNNLISVVCNCGHKTLLELHNQKNICYSCQSTLSILT